MNCPESDEEPKTSYPLFGNGGGGHFLGGSGRYPFLKHI